MRSAINTSLGFKKSRKHLTKTGRKKTGEMKRLARRAHRRIGKYALAIGKEVPRKPLLTERDLT